MVIKQYKCPWCGNEFEQDVRKVYGENVSGTDKPGHKQIVSDQVKCKNCLNFIKTW